MRDDVPRAQEVIEEEHLTPGAFSAAAAAAVLAAIIAILKSSIPVVLKESKSS